ncbi:MAG: metallophosphoesterase [Bacilli bacterium]|nr:metallophosphoesterase [Bacilli bacterium]
MEEKIEQKNEHKKYLTKVLMIFFIIIFIICSLILYARYISTSGLIIKEYKITNKNITNNFHGLKIVHISDIHYKTTVNKNDLCNLVDKINLTKPDIVVLTGDLIDKNIKLTKDDINDITECMLKVSVTIGKYAIMGENDYTYENYTTLLSNIEFTNLNDNYDLIYKDDLNYILISGVSSLSNKEKNLTEKMKNMYDYLNSATTKPVYNILLVHEPDTINDINTADFNLILAGHSLNGQINIPFIGGLIIPDNAKKYYKEYYKVKTTDLYISGGVGTSNLKYRFFNKPSFNLYRITNK